MSGEKEHSGVTVTINGIEVRTAESRVTGSHLKRSAIEQGVGIGMGYNLLLELDAGNKKIENEESIDLQEGYRFSAHPDEVQIQVNDKAVDILRRAATGKHIKESSIEQGVAMELGFILVHEARDNLKEIGDEDIVHLNPGDRFSAHPRELEIHVNEKIVKMHLGIATGLEIKQAAIAQGVSIQLDFILSEELKDRRSKIIGDSDKVRLRPRQSFIAVAPDDNS